MEEESVAIAAEDEEEEEASAVGESTKSDNYRIDENFVPIAEFEPGEEEEEAEEAEEASEGEAAEGEKPADESKEKGEEKGEDKGEEEEAVEEEQEEEEPDDTKGGKGKAKKGGKKFGRRQSQATTRFVQQETRVSGDFRALSEDFLGQKRDSISIESFHGEEAEEEEVEEEEVEEVPVQIDRDALFNVYRETIPLRNFQRMKNNLLQRKMAEFYKKKKMDHVLREADNLAENQYKYDRKLSEFKALKDLDQRDRDSITSELYDLRTQKRELRAQFEEDFSMLQVREKEIGTGLINTKTGKEIPEKLVERLLRRQKIKIREVATMRLTYIKIRNRVAEKKLALRALENIGENLHLIDYEQMKVENQSHTDKIEERDEELIKLRAKAKGAIQCLAHLREKSVALQFDLLQQKEKLEEISLEVIDCRERRNSYRLERDRYRLETEKLQHQAGVLGKPKLLCDMEDSIQELKTRSEELDRLREENVEMKKNIAAIKKNIKYASQKIRAEKGPVAITKSKSLRQRIYKGRPTLVYPELPDGQWL